MVETDAKENISVDDNAVSLKSTSGVIGTLTAVGHIKVNESNATVIYREKVCYVLR